MVWQEYTQPFKDFLRRWPGPPIIGLVPVAAKIGEHYAAKQNEGR